MTRAAANTNHEARILARVLHPERDDLPLAAARAFLKMRFDKHDNERMHELAAKNKMDLLTEAERAELDSYCRVGRVLDLLAARARRSLAKRSRAV